MQPAHSKAASKLMKQEYLHPSLQQANAKHGSAITGGKQSKEAETKYAPHPVETLLSRPARGSTAGRSLSACPPLRMSSAGLKRG